QLAEETTLRDTSCVHLGLLVAPLKTRQSQPINYGSSHFSRLRKVGPRTHRRKTDANVTNEHSVGLFCGGPPGYPSRFAKCCARLAKNSFHSPVPTSIGVQRRAERVKLPCGSTVLVVPGRSSLRRPVTTNGESSPRRVDSSNLAALWWAKI